LKKGEPSNLTFFGGGKRWNLFFSPFLHIQGFTRSHWMPPSGEFLHRIAAAAAMVNDFGRKHETLTKKYF
jgi:hypothetical protein